MFSFTFKDPNTHPYALATTKNTPNARPHQASELLSEVAQVLDEDAEAFVVQVRGRASECVYD